MGIAGTVSREIVGPTQPLIIKVYDLWSSVKADRQMPKHGDLGAGLLKDITPYIYIVDVLDDGEDYRFRFMGSAISQSIGMDLTGRCLSEDPDHEGSWRRDVYSLVYRRAEPVFTQVSLQDFDKGHVLTECVLLPLANKNGDFSMLFCAAVPVN